MRLRILSVLLTLLLSWAASGCGRPSSAPAESRPAGSVAGVHDVTPTGSPAHHGLIQYRAKDAKPALIEPMLLGRNEAVIAPGTKVIGVAIKGEARAYPLYILNNHQIVNDQLAGIPLSASW